MEKDRGVPLGDNERMHAEPPGDNDRIQAVPPGDNGHIQNHYFIMLVHFCHMRFCPCLYLPSIMSDNFTNGNILKVVVFKSKLFYFFPLWKKLGNTWCWDTSF